MKIGTIDEPVIPYPRKRTRSNESTKMNGTTNNFYANKNTKANELITPYEGLLKEDPNSRTTTPQDLDSFVKGNDRTLNVEYTGDNNGGGSRTRLINSSPLRPNSAGNPLLTVSLDGDAMKTLEMDHIGQENDHESGSQSRLVVSSSSTSLRNKRGPGAPLRLTSSLNDGIDSNSNTLNVDRGKSPKHRLTSTPNRFVSDAIKDNSIVLENPYRDRSATAPSAINLFEKVRETAKQSREFSVMQLQPNGNNGDPRMHAYQSKIARDQKKGPVLIGRKRKRVPPSNNVS